MTRPKLTQLAHLPTLVFIWHYGSGSQEALA